MEKRSLSIALIFLLAGFVLANYFTDGKNTPREVTHNRPATTVNNQKLPSENPFSLPQDSERLDMLETDVEQIKQQLLQVEQMLAELNSRPVATVSDSDSGRPRRKPAAAGETMSSVLSQRLYNVENLVRGGIDAAIAEDIVRRKNNVELKRLQLQDRARRENYINTQRYYDELEEINRQDVNLRAELGDDQYDRYLYNIRMSNRVRVNSVMLGSVAEAAGIRKNDIILNYDNKRVFNWRELKQATAEGDLGEYVSITILRDGSIFSFNIPRGPLGVQLGASRLEP